MTVAAAIMPGAAFAGSLTVAMEKAYSTNPTLNAGRAGQRAIDEQVPQALSGWRPSVTVRGEVSRTYEDTVSSGSSLFGNGFNNFYSFNSGYYLSNYNFSFYNTWYPYYRNIFGYACFPRTSLYYRYFIKASEGAQSVSRRAISLDADQLVRRADTESVTCTAAKGVTQEFSVKECVT